MKRALVTIAILAVFLAAGVARAPAAEPSGWHSEQPTAAGIGVPVPFGEVGDIEFWAPNRGALITAGNGGMPAGVYAYDGTGWYLYSTVCGGHQGRIAWTGPDEFWTVSDQRAGEEATVGNFEQQLQNRSLCQFRNGEVVASYAEPIGQADSYMRMSSAACAGPSNCWFGGERLPGTPNVGGFHLRWDGTALAASPSLTVPEPGLADPGRAVFDLTFFQRQLYESVAVRKGDQAEGEAEPSYLHHVDLNAALPFEPLATPNLVTGGTPEGLEGFRFASNGSELWALSGAVSGAAGKSTTPTLLQLSGGAFRQTPVTGALAVAGVSVAGFAMEPGTSGAWASFSSRGGTVARLAHIAPDGSVDQEVELPNPGEELSRKGVAGPISCPTLGNCWMVTSTGWLFHLGGPAPEGPNSDPAMHQLINFRPCDEACQSGVDVGAPEDDSGAEPEADLFPEAPPYEAIPIREPHRPPIYTNLRQKLIHHTVLQLSFILHAPAHVQLLAKEHRQVVAKTARMTLKKGPHQIRLRLDPKHWPTHLSFQVHQVRKSSK